MKMLLFILFALVVSLPAGAEKIQNEMVPLNMTVGISCASETVQLSGMLHVLNVVTTDGNGGFHVKTHAQPAGVSGVGLVSGDSYQGVGVTQSSMNVKAGETYTFVNNFRIIGQGKGNNYTVHTTIHHTVNANGDVTSDVGNTTIDCK